VGIKIKNTEIQPHLKEKTLAMLLKTEAFLQASQVSDSKMTENPTTMTALNMTG